MGTKTANLDLYKPATGETGDNWGPEINNNFDKLDNLGAQHNKDGTHKDDITLVNSSGQVVGRLYFDSASGKLILDGAVVALFQGGAEAFKPADFQAEHNQDGTHKPPLSNFGVEHNQDGTHGDITASSASVSGALTVSGQTNINGDVSFSDTARPRCKVALSADQSIAASTWTKLPFNMESYDNGNIWDAGNARFVAPVSGHYLFTGHVQFSTTNAGTRIIVGAYKNGALYEQQVSHSGSSTDIGCGFTFQIPCNAGDVVEIYVHHNDSVSRTVQSDNRVTYVEVIREK